MRTKNIFYLLIFSFLVNTSLYAQSFRVDESKFYRLTNKWQGESRSLAVAADGVHVEMAATKDDPSQYWKIQRANKGYFRIMNKKAGKEKSLDCDADKKGPAIYMGNLGNYGGQFWKIQQSEKGYFRLTNSWQGDTRSLDCDPDKNGSKANMADTGGYWGQFWKIEVVEVAAVDEGKPVVVEGDPCADVKCKNGGKCVDGDCECPPGYSGKNCEISSSIQSRLDAGRETPLDLVKSGVPVEELYGKSYQGGLIFFVDVKNEFPDLDGMVVAPKDGQVTNWGCYERDVEKLNNVKTRAIGAESERGALLGHGKLNTVAIANSCGDEKDVAGKLSHAMGDGWHLPSRVELDEIYNNLHLKKMGGFEKGYYWSSTESGIYYAWAMNFGNGLPFAKNKSGKQKFRAVKAF